MLLAIDAGNSNLKCGLFRESAFVHKLRCETPRQAGPSALEARLREWLASAGVAPGAIRAAIIASVVPALTPALVEAVRALCAVTAHVVGPDTVTGLTLRGPNPLELGADRLVNAVAGWELAKERAVQTGTAPQGSLVVDLGTATKLDCVSPQGAFLGGVIAPGVGISLEALVARAARLRAVELRAPAHVLGQSTTECVQSGLVHGHASLVDGLIGKLRRELPFAFEVIATGGFAPLIAPLGTELRRVEPELTLHGLHWIHAALDT